MDARHRLDDRIRAWRVTVDRVVETEGSILTFGRRGGEPVVLKVVREPGEEWRSGDVLAAFGGCGVVRALDHVAGAVLLEQVTPAQPLSVLVTEGRDDEATGVLSGVIARMAPVEVPRDVPGVEDWGEAFDRYKARGYSQIPAALFEEARETYVRLCRSQSRPRLLHGDLHHDNVLFDTRRGWLAIDPKGVVGELEYEVGAAFRNPHDRTDLFTERITIERRAGRFARDLGLDEARILAWAFAQAVLAVVWLVEDGVTITADHPWLTLAKEAART